MVYQVETLGLLYLGEGEEQTETEEATGGRANSPPPRQPPRTDSKQHSRTQLKLVHIISFLCYRAPLVK